MNQKAIYLLFIISLLSIGNAGIIREEGQCKDKNGNPCRKIIDNKKDFNINNRNIKKRSFFKSLFEERDKDNYWLNNDTMGDTFNQPYIDNNNSPKIPPSSGSNLPTVNTPSNVKSLPPKNTLSDVNNTPPKSIPSNNSIYNDEYSQNNSQNSAQNSAQNNSQNTSSNGNRKNFLGGLFDSLPDDYFDIFGIGDYLRNNRNKNNNNNNDRYGNNSNDDDDYFGRNNNHNHGKNNNNDDYPDRNNNNNDDDYPDRNNNNNNDDYPDRNNNNNNDDYLGRNNNANSNSNGDYSKTSSNTPVTGSQGGSLPIKNFSMSGFHKCSSQQTQALQNLIEDIKTYRAAALYVTEHQNEDSMFNKIFLKYFKSNNVISNVQRIFNNVNNMSNAEAYCEPGTEKTCNEGAIAWTYDKSREFHVCPEFFTDVMHGSIADHKSEAASIVVHELTHCFGSEDYAYGEYQCNALDAERSSLNADSLKYFAMSSIYYINDKKSGINMFKGEDERIDFRDVPFRDKVITRSPKNYY
jgi:hypothetical protein